MMLEDGVELTSDVIEESLKKQFAFIDRVSVVRDVCFMASKKVGAIEYSVFEMIHIDSSKVIPNESNIFIKELNKASGLDGVALLEDGYVVICNHLFRFNGDNGGKI